MCWSYFNKTNTPSSIEEESIGSIQFTGEIINVIVPTTFVYILTPWLSCLGSEFKNYSTDCEFAYKSLFKHSSYNCKSLPVS